MNNIFEKLNEWINNTEGSLVNFLTAFSPWLAPLAPAYMTFRHMQDFLHFPLLISSALALLVEILGFGTVSTALDFWFHNRKERAGMKRAPIEIVIGVFVFYLLLILISNVVIDISIAYLSLGWQQASIILVKALLTLQTIPGALIVAVRTGHRELLREIRKEKEQKVSGNLPKVPERKTETTSNLPKDWRKFRPTLTYEQVVEIASLSSEKVKATAKQAGVEERTITNWRKYAREELGIEDK